MSGSAGTPPGNLSPQVVADLQAIAADAAVTGIVDLTKGPSVPPLFVLDILQPVHRFAHQTEILEQLDIPHPIIKYKTGGDAVLDVYFSERATPFIDTGTTDTLQQAPISNISDMVFVAKQNATLAGFSVSDGTTPVARDTFQRNLTDFLIQRTMTAGGAFSGPSGAGSSGGGSGGSPGTPSAPGVSISVSTRNYNLHILSSPAYFPNVRTQFGNGLSTPVAGSIGPGLYSFGAYGVGVPVAFEPYPFSIPTQTVIPITVV
jgi:hypothetical protein